MKKSNEIAYIKEENNKKKNRTKESGYMKNENQR